MDIVIRKMNSQDAGSVAELSGELGYPTAKEITDVRIKNLLNKEHHLLLVACKDSRRAEVLGWIHIRINEALEIPTYAEIAALIVAEKYRGAKIRQKLVEAAESWCARAVDSIQLRSQITRTGAHRFYERLDYTITKTSHVFVKYLPVRDMSNPPANGL